MDRTKAFTWFVLSLCLAPLWARPSEYQLEDTLSPCERLRESSSRPGLQCTVDGHFSPVQCAEGQCWCVDAEGHELSGTRTSISAPHCGTPCQRQSSLRCSSLGHYETVQCDSSRGQCWCVDRDGMEIYGTRQRGRPQTCPGPCLVLSRGLLHSSSPRSSPQCSEDGEFLPVQCKFINSTDKREMDLTYIFNRFPEAFQSFSSFRSFFPDVLLFCFCSDKRGRELQDTGLELALDQVYDSAFTGLQSGRSFSESNIYRVLKRRLLGVQLALTGNFRCPSPCESHVGASCEPDGSFSPTQCQQGALCWCVDPDGREIPGTRAHPDSVRCGSGSSCVSQRRSALLRLFSPSSGLSLYAPPLASPPLFCPSLLRTLSDLIQVKMNPQTLLSPLVQILDGLVPSVDSALKALARSSPQRFLENLFGGKFLKMAAEGDFTGSLGTKGQGSDRVRSESGLQRIRTHRDLVLALVRVLEDPGFLSLLKNSLNKLDPKQTVQKAISPLFLSCSSSQVGSSLFIPRCTSSGGFAPVQCEEEECWCVEPNGSEIEGSRIRGRPRCPSVCERQRSAALRLQGALSAGAELHIPACSADGNFLSLQCVGEKCFCVNEEGGATEETAPHCAPRRVGQSRASGSCSEALAEVSAFKQDVMSLVALSNSSHFPLGLGLLLAKGFRFTTEIGQAEPPLLELLSDNNNAALRLAAVSVYQQLVAPERQSFQTFSPQCDSNGDWLPTQCDLSSGVCWCADVDGRVVAGSLTNRRAPKCESRCETARAQTLLSDWLRASAQCEQAQSVGSLQCESEYGCESPLCPVLDISHGSLRCGLPTDGFQRCELICSHGYQNALPVSRFQCEVQTKSWTETRPGPQACQIPQPLQTWSWAQTWSWVQSCSESGDVESVLLNALSSRGLCSAQAPVSGQSLSLCDGSTVGLQCQEDSVTLDLTWTLHLSELRPEDLPDLHTPGDQYSSASNSKYSVGSTSPKRAESGVFLNRTYFVEGVQGILGNLMMSQMMSELRLVTVTKPEFGCGAGFGVGGKRDACFSCPPGTFSSLGTCLLCPSGTYQDQEGRDSCVTCPRGSSGIGASSLNQCESECQRRRGRCSESGDFLPAQPDFLSGIWGCVTKEGVWLQWSNTETPLTDKECTALSNFQLLSDSEVQFGSDQAQILRTVSADRTSCLRECALDSSCHHVALLNGQCEMYSTSPENTECTHAPQTKGFLGNSEAEHFDWLRCSVKVRGGASSQQVFRKIGDRYASGSKSEYSTSDLVTLKRAESGVYQTQVFSANQSTQADVQRFCLSACRRDPCCEGYVLNVNRINSGSIMCGYLRNPSVLMCAEQDWDVTGRGAANRDCGAGLKYNERRGNFLFDIGGHEFTFSASDAALTKQEKGYQASLVTFSSVHLETEPKPDSVGSCPDLQSRPGPSLESGLGSSPPVDSSVLDSFRPLSVEQVEVKPQRKQPSLTFWFNKKNYDFQLAMLSCLQRCELEKLCSVADILDLHAEFFFCELFPDTGVCGAYNEPVRRQCRPLLPRAPNNTYIKTVDLSGPVKSFYQRVPFRKMVSYSVRSRIPVPASTPLSQGFRECERRCDEDHCCRGFGLIQDPKSGSKPGSGPGLVCLSLISLGVQTCPEYQTSWTTQNCSPSELRTSPEPLGWYMKPVHQWSSSPGLCPDFSLPQTSTSLDRNLWSLVSGPAHLLVDPTLSTYDIIHLSRDISADREKALDWCLHACQESESCFSVSVSVLDSGARCLLYPDTRLCGPTSSCQLTIREPAPQVYVHTDRRVQTETLDLPGSRTLRGRTVDVVVDSDRTRSVVQFLGVPFGRPPIGSLRFGPALPPDWTGALETVKPRPPCVEPGQRESGASEDCLYLNVFTPHLQRGALPVLVFFYNAPSGLLDASLLAAQGDVVVVTAPYRSSVLGFGLSDAGLSDQEAVLRWVAAHIHLVGGAKDRVTAGAERQGADILSVHLSSPGQPLFKRLILMGGSVFSPALLRSESESRRLTFDLAQDLGCDISGDITDTGHVTRCLQEVDIQKLNEAQTRILARTGPLRAWGPVLKSDQDLDQRLHRVNLLLGTSEHDGLISRARNIKKFEELSGRADSKTVFYEALVQSLGLDLDHNKTKGPNGDLLKEAASWLYSLDHSPTPSAYNLFSRALNNATRDLFVVCPSLRMAQVWAQTEAKVYLYHQPATPTRADVRIPLDVQFLFGEPLRSISSQRFSTSERRVSEALMSLMSSFIHQGDPNPSLVRPESVLPRWGNVLPSEATPTYLELSPALRSLKGLRAKECSFWNNLAPNLRGELKVEPVPIAPPRLSVGQSQPEKDSYS